MGKALYREYRPKKLEDVVGQKHITDTLRNALQKKSIAHAYLFTGPRGVGKTSIARILAHEINELDYDEESTHLDIIEIDAASNRKIDEIRDLRDKVHIAPTSAKYKVYIIDEVHMLTREAFNALLKTLEEPPAHVVFILATTEAHKVPETIISRTQRYSFKPIESDDANLHLRAIANQEGIKISNEAIALLAKHGRGSFRDSISMLDQLTGLNADEIGKETLQELLGIPNAALLEELLTAVEKQDTTLLFETTLKLRTQGAHPSTIAQNIIELLRDKLVANSLKIQTATAIQIMKALLPLTASAASYEALEILLLDTLSPPETPAKAPSPQSQVHKPVEKPQQTPKITEHPPVQKQEPEPVKAEIPKPNPADEEVQSTQELDTPANDEPKPQTNPTNANWQEVLDALKGHHNTLYGVLRMAEAHLEAGKLTLTFQFAFHQKQAAQAKHLAILRETAEKLLGKPLEITMNVATTNNAAPAIEKPVEKSANSDLQNVSNIFGGAELLES
jgi:DNA polymerase-3 subunit gamma/tau